MPDLQKLINRVVEIHGMTVGNQGEGTPYEVNDIPGYKADLPVASAIITGAAFALIGFGFAALIGRKVRRT